MKSSVPMLSCETVQLLLQLAVTKYSESHTFNIQHRQSVSWISDHVHIYKRCTIPHLQCTTACWTVHRDGEHRKHDCQLFTPITAFSAPLQKLSVILWPTSMVSSTNANAQALECLGTRGTPAVSKVMEHWPVKRYLIHCIVQDFSNSCSISKKPQEVYQILRRFIVCHLYPFTEGTYHEIKPALALSWTRSRSSAGHVDQPLFTHDSSASSPCLQRPHESLWRLISLLIAPAIPQAWPSYVSSQFNELIILSLNSEIMIPRGQ